MGTKREMREMKLKNEPQVHCDFPFPGVKTKEAWLKEVREKWSAFYKAYEETQVRRGCYYYPLKVSRWLAAFNSDEININRLMDEYCNGTSNEPTGEKITPLSIIKKLEQYTDSKKSQKKGVYHER